MRTYSFSLAVSLLTSCLISCGGTDGGYIPKDWEALKPVTSQLPTSSGSVPVQNASFSKTGTGDTFFDLPSNVTRIRIQATYNGNSSNFIVKISGNLVVNEILGSSNNSVNFDGSYLLGGGGTVEVTKSSGVLWTFTAL